MSGGIGNVARGDTSPLVGLEATAAATETSETTTSGATETAEVREFLLNRPRSTGFASHLLKDSLQRFESSETEAPVQSFIRGADVKTAAGATSRKDKLLAQLTAMESEGKVPSTDYLRLLSRLSDGGLKTWYDRASAKLIKKTFQLPRGQLSKDFQQLHGEVNKRVKTLDDDHRRKANAKKIGSWTPEQLAKIVEDSSHEKLVDTLKQLASGSNTGVAYEKLLQAIKDYALENHKGSNAAKVNDLAQLIINTSGPGAGAVKGDFAAILQTIIEAPGTKPGFPSYMELLTRVVRSAPGDVARILEDKSQADEYGKDMLSRVLASVERYDKKALPEVLGAVGAAYAVATKRYADAEKAYTKALGSGDPARMERTKRTRDRAKESMVARGREFGFAYGSAENAIDKIVKKKNAQLNRKSAVIQASLKIMAKVSDKMLPGVGKVVGGLTSMAADGMIRAQKQAVRKWEQKVKTGLKTVAEGIYKTYVDGGVAGPDSERGRRSEDREDAFQNQYENGYNAVRGKA